MFMPLPFRVYAIAGVAAATALLLLATHTFAYRSGASNVKAEWKAAIVEANKIAAKATEHRQARVDVAAKTASTRRVVTRSDSVRAADTLDSLQHAIATRDLAEESAAAATKRANTAEELLVASSKLLTRIAKEADGHVADKLMLLEAWPD